MARNADSHRAAWFRLFCTLIFTGTLVLSTRVDAQEPEVSAGPRPLGPATETIFERIPITTTGYIHGIMYGQPGIDPRPDAVDIMIGAPADAACVSIKSQDAQYVAHRGFSIEGLEPGHYNLPMDLPEGDFLRQYQSGEAAALVQTGSACPPNGQPKIYTPAAWGPRDAIPSEERDYLTIFVNVGSYDTYVLYTKDRGGSGWVECALIRNDRLNTGYNKVCIVQVMDIDPSAPLYLSQYDAVREVEVTPFRLDLGTHEKE